MVLPPPSDEDREKLVAFVNDTYELLRVLVQEKVDRKGTQLFPQELQAAIDDGWRQFDQRFSIEEAAGRIQAADSRALFRAGLYGAELRLKLGVVDWLKKRFLEVGGARLLSRLFGGIDTVLDSLLAVTGIDHALKELKDILNDCLDL